MTTQPSNTEPVILYEKRNQRAYITLNRPYAMNALSVELMERFDVRPRAPGLLSSHFSGGNQQKLVLARELAHRPKVLLVGQPTRGVDIGAIEFIHRELVKARDAGCAVLVVSVELDEILGLADRILVMNAGEVVGEVAGAGAVGATHQHAARPAIGGVGAVVVE